MTDKCKFNSIKSIKDMTVIVRNMFDTLNRSHIDTEDKITAFWPHISGLDMGYQVGIESSGLEYGKDKENTVTRSILEILDRFDDGKLDAAQAWDKISTTINLMETIEDYGRHKKG